MSSIQVPIAVPSFGPREQDAVLNPLRTGWVAMGPHVRAFEAAFADMAGAAHAHANTSGTAALHLAAAALEIGPGDEVVVPAFTWVSTANVVELLGARAVLCDVDPTTFCATAAHIEAAITERTRAIMPVHLFGHVAPMDDIMALARARGLAVIEDAACAVGSWLNGTHAGAFGDVGCFSFHPRKVLTAGEGGLTLTHRDDLAARIASLRNHGAEGTLVPPDHEDAWRQGGREGFAAQHPGLAAYVMADYVRPGFNYRMTDIQGAVMAVQLDRLDELVAARQRLAARYDDALSGLPLALPTVPEGMVHSFQAYVTRVLPEATISRDALADALADAGIQTRQGTHALHLLGAYSDRHRPEDFPGALQAHRTTLALPLFPDLSEEQQNHVIEALRAAL